jgi:hypothetical protein
LWRGSGLLSELAYHCLMPPCDISDAGRSHEPPSAALTLVPETPALPSTNVSRHAGAGRLHANSVATIIKRTSKIAGLDPARYSGHSLRSGMAPAAGDAPERAIMRSSR